MMSALSVQPASSGSGSGVGGLGNVRTTISPLHDSFDVSAEAITMQLEHALQTDPAGSILARSGFVLDRGAARPAKSFADHLAVRSSPAGRAGFSMGSSAHEPSSIGASLGSDAIFQDIFDAVVGDR